MRSPELQEYAYQQAISGLIYDAYNEKVDPATAKDNIRKIIANSQKEKMVEDYDGTIKKSSEILEKKMKQVDDLFEVAEYVAKEKKLYSLPEKHAQALFSATLGARFFSKEFNKGVTALTEVEREISSHKQAKKDRDKIGLDEDPLYDVNLVDESFTAPLKTLESKRRKIKKELAVASDLLVKYQKTAEALYLNKERLNQLCYSAQLTRKFHRLLQIIRY